MAKGSNYEREFCKELSLWWTYDKEDSCFWRTSMSGGRSTVRHRQGKKTRGHCGDICATDFKGEPLTRLVTIEVKRGYNSVSISQLLDKPRKAAVPTYEEWILQATNASIRAGTPFWMLVHKKDRREGIVMVPYHLWGQLVQGNAVCYNPSHFDSPFIRMTIKVKKEIEEIRVLPLKGWFDVVDPDAVKRISKDMMRSKKKHHD